MQQNKIISKKNKENKSEEQGFDTGVPNKGSPKVLSAKSQITSLRQRGKKIDRVKKYVSRGKQAGIDRLPVVSICGKVFNVVS